MKSSPRTTRADAHRARAETNADRPERASDGERRAKCRSDRHVIYAPVPSRYLCLRFSDLFLTLVNAGHAAMAPLTADNIAARVAPSRARTAMPWTKVV